LNPDTPQEIHSGAMKSPQFGLLLAKGEDQDHSRLHKMANSGTYSGNTRILQVFPQNTADYRFKMYANVRYWEAKPKGAGGVARSTGKEGLLWGVRGDSGAADEGLKRWQYGI
jgi:hypothetical protein